VGDTVRGLRLAAECDALVGQCINIARGQEVSINRVAELVAGLLDAGVVVQRWAARPGDVRRHQAGVRRSRDLLGFRAEVGIEEGLSRYLDWVRTLPGDPASWLEGEEVLNWKPSPVHA